MVVKQKKPNVVYLEYIRHKISLIDPFLELVTPAIFEFAGIPSNEARTSTLAKEVVATPTNYNVDYEQHNCAPVENQATFESQASSVIPNNVPTTSQSIRWSTRLTKPPSYLREYHCNLLQESSMSNVSAMPTKFPILKLMSYNKLSSSYKKFLLNVTSTFEPQFYHHAMSSKGLNCSLPPTQHFIGCKWVYQIKHGADIFIECYKARLVVKWYSQQEGLDYDETFSSVAKLVTVKILLTMVVSMKWELVQLDVNDNGFLACKPALLLMDPSPKMQVGDGKLLASAYLTVSCLDNVAIHKLNTLLI
ncbi:Retrovirus-related Pol polyprotein from transposon TNT 1-94 [Cucumis melo var. makuwa]|uniref:Retrovirus-related Pol polyprotein from transposon TNT 1-94 n=1 Tax=Cucumis melo var. makuwa TaxID=1194695 RepID=A0A5D3C9G2_CUCMM|nr:Retrovirus-related Pol polyprotein from transposon TNT 1-94 [Cucumis melo var. makuwa]